jgi:hypothetical protein
VQAAASKTVTVGTQTVLMQAGVAGSVAQFNVTTTGIALGSYSATISGNPNTVSVQGTVFINNSGAGTLTLVGTGSTTVGTYPVMRLTIDGTQSGNFTLSIIRPDPTVINFGNATARTYYTYPGMVFPVNYTLTPSAADWNKITWGQTSTHAEVSAVVSNTTGTSISVRTQGTNSNAVRRAETAREKHTVTLTGTPPNGNVGTATINTSFVMWGSTSRTGSYTTEIGTLGGGQGGITTINRGGDFYIRAYYRANATQWATSSNSAGNLTVISTDNYTITSGRPTHATVHKESDGITYRIRNHNPDVSWTNVLFTITVGSGAAAQTYTHVFSLWVNN